MNRRPLIPTWLLVLVALAAFLALVLTPDPASAAAAHDASPADPRDASLLDWLWPALALVIGAIALVPLWRLGRDS